jgi:hypothetical protein
MVILADLAAPGHCLAAAGLGEGLGMAPRHPGVWRWRVEPCDRAREMNATTCHTGCRQAHGDGRMRLLGLGQQGSEELQGSTAQATRITLDS